MSSPFGLLTRDREIRLLVLKHGLSGDRIECSLQRILLRDARDYIALSYVWGDVTSAKEIQVDGVNFSVTANLEAALQQLRDERTDQRFWIDAICINQRSINERNKQVLLMRDIYASASQVLIWLGPGNVATDWAVHAMRKIAAYAQDDKFTLEQFDDITKLCQDQCGSKSATTQVDIASNVRQGLNDIFGRPWFDRTWTIQELAVARCNPILACGNAKMCWECFITANRKLDQYIAKCNLANKDSDYWIMPNVQAAVYTQKHSKLNQVRIMAQAVAELKSQGTIIQGTCFVDILAATRFSQCTDPRDKIYGILGLVEEEAAEITVDYSLPIAAVFQKATKYIIKRRGFAILASQGTWELDDDWPSWVVDFRHPRLLNWMPLMEMTDDYGSKYCALPLKGREAFHVFSPQGILRMYGLIVDEIVATAKTWKFADDKDGKDSDLRPDRLILSTDAFRVFANAARPCDACIMRQVECDHLQYSPENGSGSSELRSAVLRTLISDWLGSNRACKQIDGLRSDQILDSIERIVRNVVEDEDALISMHVFDQTSPNCSALTDTLKVAILEKLFKGLNSQVVFRTKLGWVGHGPPFTKVGDHCAVMYGGDVPYVLRHIGSVNEGRFRLVGACYVDGIMFGELTSNPLSHENGDMSKPIQLSAFDIC